MHLCGAIMNVKNNFFKKQLKNEMESDIPMGNKTFF